MSSVCKQCHTRAHTHTYMFSRMCSHLYIIVVKLHLCIFVCVMGDQWKPLDLESVSCALLLLHYAIVRHYGLWRLHHSWFTQCDAYHPTVSPQGVPQVSCSLYTMSRAGGEREGMCSNPILYCNHTQCSTRVHTIGISLPPSHIRPMHFHITQTNTHTWSPNVLMALPATQ